MFDLMVVSSENIKKRLLEKKPNKNIYQRDSACLLVFFGRQKNELPLVHMSNFWYSTVP